MYRMIYLLRILIFLLHFATREEMVTDAEWKYLLDCLNGNRIYSLDGKFKMTGENGIGGSGCQIPVWEDL